MSSYVYGVHAVMDREITVTKVVYGQLEQAEKYAREMSADTGVLAAAVTRYAMNKVGDRSPVALFVDGRRQDRPHISDNRRVFACGPAH